MEIGGLGAFQMPQGLGPLGPAPQPPSLESDGARGLAGPLRPTMPAGLTAPSFDQMLTHFVGGVHQAQKASESEVRQVLLGNTANIHQAMISMEESRTAMTLMVEVRNKLVESFQEVMRMPM